MSILEMSAVELSKSIKEKKYTVMDATEAVISQMEQTEAGIGAYITMDKDSLRKKAQEIQDKIEKGELTGPLAGVPMAIKDNICTKGVKTTCASKILGDFIPPYNAEAVTLLEDAGVVIIGKTNMDEFAMGSTSETSAYGTTKNPWNQNHVPGGSSGGSAAAVAAGECFAALGSDTGGSIRQPASYNGVVGLKPTYGSVSRYGVIAMASSTDVVGPIATTVADTKLVFDCISGIDERDGTTISLSSDAAVKKETMRIGVIREGLEEGVDAEVKQTAERAVEMLRDAGHKIVDISLPTSKYALAVYYIVVPAELTSNLARYDGIKYGTNKSGETLSDVYENSRSGGFMDENKRRILIGNYVLSSGYYDAYYHKAQAVRTVLINEFAAAFEKCDVLVCPTAPTPAFKLGENTADPLQMYMADILTVPASMAGLAAVSVPAGVTQDNLPVGIQFIAPMRKDETVLAAAHMWEELNV